MDMALARSKISNRMVAQRLGVDETTIRRWRKENIEFERAFTEAREVLRKINRVAGKSLDVRKRKVVTTSPDGVKTTVEDVLPTHNDIAVFSKLSVLVPASIARKNVSVMCFAR
jgi:transposase-like protein